MTALVPLSEETPENLISFSTMRGHSQKVAVYKLGREFSPESYHADTLILGLAAFRTMRNKFWLFKAPRLVQLTQYKI